MRILLALMLLIAVAACGRSGLADMEDYELQKKAEECIEKRPTTPGMGHACENIRKECVNRRKEIGRYVCPTTFGY